MERVFQARDGVVAMTRGSGRFLVSPSGRHVRISPTVERLWSSLVHGATLRELRVCLDRGDAAAAPADETLVQFLDRLDQMGLLDTAAPEPPSPPAGLVMLPVDALARVLAWPFRTAPVPLLFVAVASILSGAAAGIALLLSSPDRPRLLDVADWLGWTGGAVVLLAAIPLHELAHAVAARAALVPVDYLGIRIRRWRLPRIHVSTSQAFGASRRTRFLIAAAGPMMDLTIAGGAAWIFHASESSALRTACALPFLCALVSFQFGTNPLLEGDGSHMLESLLDNDLLRRAAVSAARPAFVLSGEVWMYRSACLVHLAASALLYSRLF